MNSRILEKKRKKEKENNPLYCLDTAIYTSKENGFHEWYAFTQITDFRYGLSCPFAFNNSDSIISSTHSIISSTHTHTQSLSVLTCLTKAQRKAGKKNKENVVYLLKEDRSWIQEKQHTPLYFFVCLTIFFWKVCFLHSLSDKLLLSVSALHFFTVSLLC